MPRTKRTLLIYRRYFVYWLGFVCYVLVSRIVHRNITALPHVKVKVKRSRYRPGVAQRVGRGIALLFLDLGTRRGWVVSVTPRPHLTPGKDTVPIVQVKVKVKWSLYKPGVVQRVGRGIALLFHDLGTRRRWVVSSTPRPHFTPGKDPVPILQEAGCAPVSVMKIR